MVREGVPMNMDPPALFDSVSRGGESGGDKEGLYKRKYQSGRGVGRALGARKGRENLDDRAQRA